MTDMTPVLETENLKKYFTRSSNILESALGRGDRIHAVDDVSLKLYNEDAIGVIGESGCGKTTLLMTLAGLSNPTSGLIKFDGKDTSGFTRTDWKDFRRRVQIIFQDPFNSLDPKMTVRGSLLEPLRIHGLDDKEARIDQVLREVGLTPPQEFLDRLPKNLSGGQLQRVSIARALILEPDVLLADEPVSMLDVSTQAAILKLLSRLIDEYDMSLLYISHDISTVVHICEEINVMYLGRIIESGQAVSLVEEPAHPYSQALINAIPVPNPHVHRQRTKIESVPQVPINIGEGCRFRDRCPERMDVCEITPRYLEYEKGRWVACHLYYEHQGTDLRQEFGGE